MRNKHDPKWFFLVFVWKIIFIRAKMKEQRAKSKDERAKMKEQRAKMKHSVYFCEFRMRRIKSKTLNKR